MTEFLFGALGMILILAAFSAGFVSCHYLTKHFNRLPEPEEPELTPEQKEIQKREIEAQAAAFTDLMGYNMNVAYGLDKKGEPDAGGEDL